MKVDEARPVNAELLNTPRPNVTQPVYLRPVSSPRRNRMAQWKRIAIALGLTGLAASPLPFISSVGAHLGVMILLAFGTVNLRTVGTSGKTSAIEVDTAVAGPEEVFDLAAEEVETEELNLRALAAAGPLGGAEIEPAAFSEAEEAVTAPSGFGGTGGDSYLTGIGQGSGTGAGPGGGIADGLGQSEGSGFGGTDLFNVKGRGQKFVYVIDRSHSMNTNVAWEAAVDELLNSLRKLPLGVQFQVIFYNEEAVVLDISGQRRDSLIRLTDDTRDRAIGRIQNTKPGGGTNHEKALRRALELRPDVIFLLTDADDADPKMIGELSRRNRKFKSQQATIHVIQFYHEGSPNRAIKKLAEENKGTYHEINTLNFRDKDA